ncbi:type II toxin-antitoxin system death-on-curing family toxin [Methylobacterium sp. 17Sr1-1]|uniref:type II toxin-antitoxin system death-on-curing family toxin n=1 Tax=Methylobacterium sp. 17Sr1-1 TaxID=2202826 RepID=UPI000D701DD3|nr:type II toxin-antitoxin system death-on-curing family toxin [Methylobacterium sp. 17Sr1-1]AWN51651.1 type II toxin-antitoxin system death-on-curing family toxin [Methylobacterium sp. 17Sr1-1]
MTAPIWIARNVVLAIHADQIAEHGGLLGLRDNALLDSALARPRQQAAYGSTDLFDLAAAYAFGIARNHPFIDGNKRVSFVVAAMFLQLNGPRVAAPETDVVRTWLSIAAGEIGEAEVAAWLSANTH